MAKAVARVRNAGLRGGETAGEETAGAVPVDAIEDRVAARRDAMDIRRARRAEFGTTGKRCRVAFTK